MAATRIISGGIREIWRELVPQPGGAPQIITTGIRMNDIHRSRVRGLLVINSLVGAPVPWASITVVGGFLVVTVGNGFGGTSITWTLDVERTESQQQAIDPANPNGEIAVVNGTMGVIGAPQTLAQTYDFGAAAVDQTMVIDTATKGGGVVIDASTAAVAAPTPALEIRQQSAGAQVPFVVALRETSNAPAYMHFTKARGTFAAPTQIATNDLLARITTRGYTNGAFRDLAIISVYTLDVGAGPGFLTRTSIDFDAAYDSSTSRIFRMWVNDAGGAGVLECLNDGFLQPDVNNQGSVGTITGAKVWKSLAVYTANAIANVILGASAVGGGANHTVLLPNDATMPIPQANQVYIGALDFGGGGMGSNLAALALSAEEPAVIATGDPANAWIPVHYNGRQCYLFARDMTPA